MELPTKLPKSLEHRRILGEFYDLNKNKQWFHRGESICDASYTSETNYCDFL